LSRRIARHEAPLHTGRKSRSTTAAKTRGLDLFDDLLTRNLLSQNTFPHFIATDLAIGGQLPRALEGQGFEANEVLRIRLHAPINRLVES
jgi:hypothetical protein